MMQVHSTAGQTVWRFSWQHWAVLVALVGGLFVVFNDALGQMVRIWFVREEYSHGILIPFIAAFLLWQKRDVLEIEPFKGSWFGLLLIGAGLALAFIGELATLYQLIQYGFIVILSGLVLAFVGVRNARHVWPALVFLLFMVPLPQFLYQNLSATLQLWSSQIGVAVIRLAGISVNLQGNVIDLGNYQLQVVEACNGLRYLFPLMSLAFLCAYLFQAPLWQRALVFLSAAPITVFMNSFRIGVIGITVEHWGVAMAEGFLHDFEGWIVFMFSGGLLLLEIALLAKLTGAKRPLREVFGITLPPPVPAGVPRSTRPWSKPALGAAVTVAGAALLVPWLDNDAQEVIPARQEFAGFPARLGVWQGRSDTMEQIYIDALKFDDYLLMDFENNLRDRVNLYVAYYGSQRKGESAHSPRSCIPGDGWRIQGAAVREIAGATVDGAPLSVNRVIIEKGDHRQLVYYWFQQRGRVITNEYAVKWYLLTDALAQNRTDGALVRLVTRLEPGADPSRADAVLADFAAEVVKRLDPYVPGRRLQLAASGVQLP